ncbi:NAD(P)-binding protein [Trichoderma citrinoviride]|uniref:NAD(P)-binding protein n=1 Tax=Trichoderma citrinoviride TaxID=58853 RepID=A0A2T4BLU8_9HYPO|nr:NAD(P)-binding protein [Trichoderma citrinoviride]PTB70294.1 NAD(P)-binding protein [Trichoderma citrinoviride]
MKPSPYSVESLFRVDGLVAVITGGGSGLGRITAHALAVNGARAVYVLGRREDALGATRDTCPKPEAIRPIVCDVTSKDALKAAADRVRAELGYCDVVFANSGIITADNSDLMKEINNLDLKDILESLWEYSMEEFTQSFHVNATAVFYTALAFLELLDEGNKRAVIPQKSQVIVTGSVASFARLPKAGFAHGSSKAAAVQLAKQLATMLAPHKIRVNSIAPGLYPSEITERDIRASSTEIREEGSLPGSFIPLARMGTEEEFAGAMLYLTSKAGGYVDGTVLLTDGGRLSIATSTY